MKSSVLVTSAIATLAAGAASAVCVIPAPRELEERGGVFAAPADFFEKLPTWKRDSSLPPEGYALDVSASGVSISAADEAGAFYAVQTIRQLAPTNSQGLTLRQVADLRIKVCRDSAETPGLGEIGRRILRDVRDTYEATWAIPCVLIRDWPRYPWRAMMLDEARTFFGKHAVLDMIDRMAEYKMNVFHWHLTDDQGWRIDVPGFPELVKWGATRKASVVWHTGPVYPNGYDNPPECILNGRQYGPYFYTPEDIAEILAHAKARHVKVVPEIEFPGHARAFLAAHPEFSCMGESLPRTPRCALGIEQEVVCGGNPEFYPFMERLLDAVCTMFPDSEVIHIGGDECFCERWKTCSKCQALMKKENLPNERALQSRMTKHFAGYLNSKGRKVIGWDGILTGEPLDASGILVYFRMPRPGSRAKTAGEAAALGHGVVAIRTQDVYFNYSQGLEDDPNFYWGSLPVRLSDAYACDPMQGVAAEDAAKMLGAEGMLWSGTISDRHDLEWKTWPRAIALAEALWLGEGRPGFDDFAKRLATQRRRLVKEGLGCALLK